jgi:hypothetical protein
MNTFIADNAEFQEFIRTAAEPQEKADAVRRKRWKGREPEAKRQTLLLSGMDCLRGQQDLFEVDGQD